MEDVVYYGDKREMKKNVIIKNILNVIDLAFDPEEKYSRTREKVRKVVMDEVNDYHRFILGIWPNENH